MLETIERVLVVVADRAEAAATWRRLFGAVTIGDSTSEALNARFTTMRAGTAEFEFHEPLGPGPAAFHYKRWGPGLLGAGFGTRRYDEIVRYMTHEGVMLAKEGDRLVVTADQAQGMFSIITPVSERERAGAIGRLYEVTLLSEDWRATTSELTRIFALEPSRFVPVASGTHQYEGTLAMFRPAERLDRLQVVSPRNEGAMSEFLRTRGPGLYMCYVECDDVLALARRLDKHGSRYSFASEVHPEEGLFIHSSAALGVAVGVSRTNHAWNWSGQPERAQPPVSA